MKPTHFGKFVSLRRVRRDAALLAFIAATAVFSGGCCKLVPWALAVDPSLTGSSDADGMLEPGETVVVAPTWSKSFQSGLFPCSTSDTETGTASSLTGPVVADYSIGNASTSYGRSPRLPTATSEP
jgi:hypothetical protein